MARPQLIQDADVQHCAALYACGGDLIALAEWYGVKPDTLRRRIRERYGALPVRIPHPPCTSRLADAAALLDTLALSTDCERVREMADAVRAAIDAADERWEHIRQVGTGATKPAVPVEG